MKVSELTGPLLDYWAGKADNVANLHIVGNRCIKGDYKKEWLKDYSPSTDWAQGGPIIEREGIGLGRRVSDHPDGTIIAEDSARILRDLESPRSYGQTPLIAAMRCYVASKFGDELPDE